MSEDFHKPIFGNQGGGKGSGPSPEVSYGGQPQKEQTFLFGEALPSQKLLSENFPEAIPAENFAGGDDDAVEGELVYPPPLPGSGEPQNPHLRRFVKKGWKDVWAAALFLLCTFFVVVLGIVNLITFDASQYPPPNSSNAATDEGVSFTLSTFDVFVLQIGIGLSFASVFADLFFLSNYPEKMIYFANLCCVVMVCLYAILCLATVNPLIGLLMLCVAGVNILWFYYARKRIGFSAIIMRTATSVTKKHKSLFACQVVMVGVCGAFFFFWVNALTPSVYRADRDASTSWDACLTVFSVLLFLWVMQVAVNVVLVTTSGVVATWYFLGREERMPSQVTRKSFVRAITTSFGSICFGSLVVASIQLVRWLAEVSRRNHEQNFLTCILDCLFSLLQGILEYVNRYAYVHIAIYGYDYLTAAKHTFELFRQCLGSGLYNDCLVDTTLTLMNLAFSLFLGLVCGLCTHSLGVGVIAFVFALIIRSLLLSTVSNAVLTIFVCYAEVPEALAASDPELYNLFVQGDRGFTNDATLV